MTVVIFYLLAGVTILASKIFSAFWMTGSFRKASCDMFGGGGAGLAGEVELAVGAAVTGAEALVGSAIL
jgi:hypothetical protein